MLKTLLTIGSGVTIGFGIWHLFVPSIWKWYSYFPREAEELIMAVRAINVLFSLSLVIFGIVTLIFIYRKPIEYFYVKTIVISLSILWGIRVLMQIVFPQGSVTPVLQYGMLSAFIIIFILFVASLWLIR